MISLNHLNEGYLFSSKTISIDLYKFKSGKSNKLFIVGVSGSGKTTLGKKLAKKYNVKYYETDMCDNFNPKQDPRKIKEGFKEYHNCVINMINSPDRAVIEGVGIISAYYYYHYPNEEYIRNQLLSVPTIFMGTSALVSSLRAYQRARNKDNPDSIIMSLEALYYSLKKNFTLFEKKHNEFMEIRKNIPGSVVKEFKI